MKALAPRSAIKKQVYTAEEVAEAVRDICLEMKHAAAHESAFERGFTKALATQAGPELTLDRKIHKVERMHETEHAKNSHLNHTEAVLFLREWNLYYDAENALKKKDRGPLEALAKYLFPSSGKLPFGAKRNMVYMHLYDKARKLVVDALFKTEKGLVKNHKAISNTLLLEKLHHVKTTIIGGHLPVVEAWVLKNLEHIMAIRETSRGVHAGNNIKAADAHPVAVRTVAARSTVRWELFKTDKKIKVKTAVDRTGGSKTMGDREMHVSVYIAHSKESAEKIKALYTDDALMMHAIKEDGMFLKLTAKGSSARVNLPKKKGDNWVIVISRTTANENKARAKAEQTTHETTAPAAASPTASALVALPAPLTTTELERTTSEEF